MRRPNNSVFAIDHFEHVFCRAEVIDVSVNRIVLFEFLISRPRIRMGEVDRFGRHQIPVATEVSIWFLRGNHQKILVGYPCGTVEIDLLFHESLGPWIPRVRVIVEVAEVKNVDAEGTENGNRADLVIEVIAITELLVEIQMKVTGHHLVAGQRLEYVVMRIR